MPDWVVTTAFRGQDEMTKTFKKMGAGANRFGREASRSFKRASSSAMSLKTVMGGILGAGIINRGVMLLRQGLQDVVTEFADFDDAITAASAKFGIFNKESKEFLNLKKTAREVGATTEFTSAQAAKACGFWQRQVGKQTQQ